MCAATSQMVAKVAELMELRKMIEDLNAEAELIADEIKAYMGEEETMTAGSYDLGHHGYRPVHYLQRAELLRPDGGWHHGYRRRCVYHADDQMASSVGGLVFIDFANPAKPVVEQIDFDFDATNHALCIIDSGADHADLTDEYGAIPGELAQICRWFGKKTLRQVAYKDFLEAIPNNLMPYIGRVAAGKLDRLTIFGNDYETPDGTCLRDYIHVVDLAVGHVKALEYAQSNRGVEAINLGAGIGVSVLDLVKTFDRVNGITLPYIIGPRRPGDLPAFWADAEKAKKLLNWQAVHTLDDMCISSWKYAQNESNY